MRFNGNGRQLWRYDIYIDFNEQHIYVVIFTKHGGHYIWSLSLALIGDMGYVKMSISTACTGVVGSCMITEYILNIKCSE